MRSQEAPTGTRPKIQLTGAHEAAITCALFSLAGFFAPWWAIVVPAFGSAAWLSARKAGSNPVFKIALWAAGVWILVAAFHDLSLGGRLSSRIGAVMHLPWAPLLYVLTGFMVGLIAGLAAEAGCLAARLIYGAVEEATEPVPPPGK